MGENVYDLEERLLEFAAAICRLTEGMPGTLAAGYVADHLLRSGTSPFLNHGEAQAAESRSDFVHKMRVCLKELREARRCLRLIKRVPLPAPADKIAVLLRESDELIRIFAASIRTATQNAVREEPGHYTVTDTDPAPPVPKSRKRRKRTRQPGEGTS